MTAGKPKPVDAYRIGRAVLGLLGPSRAVAGKIDPNAGSVGDRSVCGGGATCVSGAFTGVQAGAQA